MTKTIRIENADTSDYKVIVEVYEMGPTAIAGDRVYLDSTPDKLVETHELKHPTAMIAPYITSTRYLVIREIK